MLGFGISFKAIANRHNGVSAFQCKPALPSSDDFIAAHPDKVEYLPGPGDCFLDTAAVPYG